MGASGFVGSQINGSGTDRGSTLAFLVGLIGSHALLQVSGWTVDTHITASLSVLILGGLAVGIGTRFANGCTSGHGVCGMSRLSLRGFVATAAYIGAGALTVAGPKLGSGV